MILVNKQLEQFKDNNGEIVIKKMHDAFPHLYDMDDNKHSDFYVDLDDQNENVVVETVIEDSKVIKEKVEQYIREQKQFIKIEQQKLQKQLIVYDKRIKAMNAVLSDRSLKEFTQEDCCRSMYEKLPQGETSNKGKVGIIFLDCLVGSYKKPEYQLFRLEGGFGCTPTNSGNACYGKFCADGSEARMEKFDFIGIGNDDVEKIAQELESSWTGGAEASAEKADQEM